MRAERPCPSQPSGPQHHKGGAAAVGPWALLVSNGCHHNTQRFLCALFAPVCLPELAEVLWPCRGMRDACGPVMNAFGFSWPRAFNCTWFPATHACVCQSGAEPLRCEGSRPGPQAICDAYNLGDDREKQVQFGYCKSHFAFSFKLEENSVEGEDRKLVTSRQIKVLLRKGAFTPEGAREKLHL